MGKYEVRWCRIWDFTEEVEAETEEEVYDKILEERKTAGSTVQIISVMPIDIEEVKQKGKKEEEEDVELFAPAKRIEILKKDEVKGKHVTQRKKEKK